MKPTVEQIDKAKADVRFAASSVESIEKRIARLKQELDGEREKLVEERKNLQAAEAVVRGMAKKLSFAEAARLLPTKSQTGMNRFNGGLAMRSRIYGHAAGVGDDDE